MNNSKIIESSTDFMDTSKPKILNQDYSSFEKIMSAWKRI